MKYLDEHAPDTHAVLLRVSVQTGLSVERLRAPGTLTDTELGQVEEAVRRILGVDQINL